jgi:hypothetical protein
METIEQILERQCAELSFKEGKVAYFSISTQWDTANTISEAIQNILEADVKYSGKTPLAYASYMHTKPMYDEEFTKLADSRNILGLIYTVLHEDVKHIEFLSNINE